MGLPCLVHLMSRHFAFDVPLFKIASSGAIFFYCSMSSQEDIFDRPLSPDIDIMPVASPSSPSRTTSCSSASDLSFESVPAQFVIDSLHALQPSDCLTKNDKPVRFWSTYKKWESMNADQRGKSKRYFEQLAPETKHKVLDQAKDLQTDVRKQSKKRQETTSKDDLARVVHMMSDPDLSSLWTKAMTPMTRRELDARRGNQHIDPWGDLATEFNDYQNNIYRNATVEYNTDGSRKISKNGTYQSVPQLENAASICFSIDPCNISRPLRDGGWIRTVFLYVFVLACAFVLPRWHDFGLKLFRDDSDSRKFTCSFVQWFQGSAPRYISCAWKVYQIWESRGGIPHGRMAEVYCA
eukprot:m.23568 g.23568  ORF g.23568 m.23568 type:complete len:352 (-) comp12958_c0_seq1:902-1957(-)